MADLNENLKKDIPDDRLNLYLSYILGYTDSLFDDTSPSIRNFTTDYNLIAEEITKKSSDWRSLFQSKVINMSIEKTRESLPTTDDTFDRKEFIMPFVVLPPCIILARCMYQTLLKKNT